MSDLDDKVHVHLRLSHPVVQAGVPVQLFLRVDVSADAGASIRRPFDLAVVLDRSGSMAGAKIAYARDAVTYLIDQLLPQDQLALIAYDSEVETVFPRQEVGNGAVVMRAKVSMVQPRGTTNLAGGLAEGIGQLGKGGDALRRALLFSDGLANVGVTDADGIARIAAAAAGAGASVSTFGVGADYDQHLMAAVADAGGGAYYLIESPEEIPGFFAEELGELGETVALNLEVAFDARAAEVTGILGMDGGFPARAGDILAGGTRSVLLALNLAPSAEGEAVLGTVTCRWRPLGASLAERSVALDAAVRVTHDLAQVEAHVDRDVLLAAQLQLVASEHLAAVEAAQRGDRRAFEEHRHKAAETLATLGDDAERLAPEQLRLIRELRAADFEATRTDARLHKRAHHGHYRQRKEDYLHRETRRSARGRAPMSASAIHLKPWIDAPLPAPPVPPLASSTFDRVRGMLLGLAIGDALGNTNEGLLPSRRRGIYGEIRDYLPNRHAEARPVGLPSDDTQMAFWMLESQLSQGRLDPEDLAERFSSQQIYGIGGTVRAFLRAYKDEGRPWFEAGQPSAGNGALMRIAPVVLPEHLAAPTSAVWRDTIAATVLTHRDDAAVAASVGFVGLLIECLSRAADETPPDRWWPETFLRYARPVERGTAYSLRVPGNPFRGTLCGLVEQEVLPALDMGRSVLDAGDRWYSGAYLLETLPCVLHILGRHGGDPEAAIVRAVNDTKDNDTIAAIVGAAVGALHGEAALPLRWREGLLGRLGADDDGRVQALIERAIASFLPGPQ